MKAGGSIEGIFQLYSGDYLDMEYYDWAKAYRVELRTVMLSTMTLVLDQATEEMRIQLLKKLIELEPSQWDRGSCRCSLITGNSGEDAFK